jgi:MscS family membrane protein
MNDYHVVMNQTFLGNSLWQYTLFALILFAGLAFKRYLSRFSNRMIFKLFRDYAKDVNAERFVVLMHPPVSFTIMVVIIYIAFSQLTFPYYWHIRPSHEFGVRYIIEKGYFVFLYSAVIWIFLRLADFFTLVMLHRVEKVDNKYSGQVIPFFSDFVKVTIIIFGILIILGSVFTLNVGTLITGLGIGGLAIALAAKETLENLLGSFTIFLDKPFVVGDMVRVAGITGVVEKVGFRSTRLRTLEKSFVTLPNRKMIESELDNLTMRTFRRGDLTIGLTYSTTPPQLKAIVDEIQQFINNHQHTNSEGKVRFHEFGPSSLDIMVLFFVDTMDWTVYLDVKQEILYKIIDIVHKNKASFAFPSSSIYIEKNGDNRPVDQPFS